MYWFNLCYPFSLPEIPGTRQGDHRQGDHRQSGAADVVLEARETDKNLAEQPGKNQARYSDSRLSVYPPLCHDASVSKLAYVNYGIMVAREIMF